VATIVFCEDDPTIQKLIGVAMRSTTHHVHVASDGAQGLELIRLHRPDLVCTDLSMPGLDGFELMDALKADDALAHIPVVLLTASAQRGTSDEGGRHGAVAVLVKPFSTADLRAQIDQALAGLSAARS
jgi:CheY-like chemotaxis protein